MKMTQKKRHSNAEIAAKLTQAGLLAKGGNTQGEIARALGISVMTFHRWRRAHSPLAAVAAPIAAGAPFELGPDHRERIAALQLENSRLRRLITDLLLEKLKLEEAHSQPVG
jgi:putative transposase